MKDEVHTTGDDEGDGRTMSSDERGGVEVEEW